MTQDNNLGWKIHQDISSPNSCSQQGCLWGLSRLLRALPEDRDPTTFLSNVWASFYRNQDLECTPHQSISLKIGKCSCFLSFRGNLCWNWLTNQRWQEKFTYLDKKKSSVPWGALPASCPRAEQTGKKWSGGWKCSGRTPDSECAQHIQLAQGQGRRWKQQGEPWSCRDEQEGYEGKQEIRWRHWSKCSTGKKKNGVFGREGR